MIDVKMLAALAAAAMLGLFAILQFNGGNVITKITDDYAVAPQLAPDDLKQVAEQGYKSIIVNRPDGEGTGQPSFSEMAAAAAALGLKVEYVPISPMGMTPVDADRFKQAYDTLPKPVLAYCRSGARSTNIFKLALQR